MTAVDEQDRDAYGRWTTMRGAAAGVTLAPTERPETPEEIAAYNSRGSYLYPPAPVSVEQHHSFWHNVHIPDDILRSVEVAYRQKRLTQEKRDADIWFTQWEADPANRDPSITGNAKRSRFKTGAEWEHATNKAQREYIESTYKDYPKEIPATAALNLLAAYGAWWNSGGLSESEQKQVDEHRGFIRNGRTVWEQTERFRLREIHDATRTPYSETLERATRQEILELRRQLAGD